MPCTGGIGRTSYVSNGSAATEYLTYSLTYLLAEIRAYLPTYLLTYLLTSCVSRGSAVPLPEMAWTRGSICKEERTQRKEGRKYVSKYVSK